MRWMKGIIVAILLALASVPPTPAQNTNAQLLALVTSNVPSGQPSVLTAASLRAVLNAMINSTNVNGASCPTTAVSKYQPWANTTNSPTGTLLSVFDGTLCIPWAIINESTHVMNLAGSIEPPHATNLVARFGSMDLCQRGAGASCSIAVGASSTAYTVDGCYLTTGANEASTVSSVPGIATGSNRAAQVQRNSAQTGTAQMTFGCPLDSDEIAMARGNYVTLSFTVAAGANWSPVSGAITANVVCGTGSPVKQTVGYSNSSTVATLSQNLTAGGSATRLQVTSAAVVPSNCTQMEVQWTEAPTGSAGANDWFQVDSVRLEVVLGPTAVASSFQEIDFGTQLRMAQRHYFKTFPYGTAPAQSAGIVGAPGVRDTVVTVATAMEIPFPVQMRVNPSVTTFNPLAANANCRDVTGSSDLVVGLDPNSALSTDRVYVSCAAGGTVGDNIYIHIAADGGI